MKSKKFILSDDFKQNAFTTPEGYFEALQIRVAGRISAATSKKQSWFAALRTQMAFAMAFVALTLTGYGGLYLLNNFTKDTTEDVMTAEDYSYAIDLLGIDEQSMLRAMNDERIDVSVNTEDIINYLATANISIADIAYLE